MSKYYTNSYGQADNSHNHINGSYHMNMIDARTYTHVHTHTHAHIRIHIHIHTRMHMYIHTRIIVLLSNEMLEKVEKNILVVRRYHPFRELKVHNDSSSKPSAKSL